jgi:hypothetical protein
MSFIDPNTFVFFGCWNNINCKYKYLYRDIVLQSIKSIETDSDNVFIAGDNWYNLLVNNSKDLEDIITKEVKDDKVLEITHYLTPVLISGYYALYNMNKNIYICVGNHDETEDGQEENDPEIKQKIKKNCMIETQKYYLKNINEIPIDNREYVDYTSDDILSNPIIQYINNDNPPSLNQLQQFAKLEEEYTRDLDNAHLNTNKINLYSGNHIEIIDNKESSYMVVIINTNILSLEYINQIAIRIKKKRYSSDKQLFVMGHIPLFSDKKKAINKNSEIMDDVFTALYDMLVEYNCIYLCADTHNFNIMKITNTQNSKSLIQITSGTGGADPDLIEEKTGLDYFSKSVNIENYNIYYNSINSYGYCKIIKQADQVIVTYNKIIDAQTQDLEGHKGTEGQGMQFYKYHYIIKNNDVSYYTVRENKELFKNIEENIEKIANASIFYRDIYCADGYMNMNHVIKSEKNETDKQVICFNKAFKKKKKKNKKVTESKEKL